jgi:hypothetical protein
MDPVSLLAGHQQKVDFAPTALLIGSGENWVQTRGLVSRRAMDYIESPFFGSSGPTQLC